MDTQTLGQYEMLSPKVYNGFHLFNFNGGKITNFQLFEKSKSSPAMILVRNKESATIQKQFLKLKLKFASVKI